ncbi:hypothetical protein HYH03_010712 [Edaphochlamys debaryana]|uniref:Uncharacterized protein n=1 Tax=Edaphochlamys debaryana TaxID=47281 RepID=A0A835Y1G5_9CHLO|nr:hypothetical protein HYH03_010712 [Edaphochlamys debaryana]|eukprot:KAG2490790.1 hypothetical protein HYH03_010712 [Edaphochlamys debaryana]
MYGPLRNGEAEPDAKLTTPSKSARPASGTRASPPSGSYASARLALALGSNTSVSASQEGLPHEPSPGLTSPAAIKRVGSAGTPTGKSPSATGYAKRHSQRAAYIAGGPASLASPGAGPGAQSPFRQSLELRTKSGSTKPGPAAAPAAKGSSQQPVGATTSAVIAALAMDAALPELDPAALALLEAIMGGPPALPPPSVPPPAPAPNSSAAGPASATQAAAAPAVTPTPAAAVAAMLPPRPPLAPVAQPASSAAGSFPSSPGANARTGTSATAAWAPVDATPTHTTEAAQSSATSPKAQSVAAGSSAAGSPRNDPPCPGQPNVHRPGQGAGAGSGLEAAPGGGSAPESGVRIRSAVAGRTVSLAAAPPEVASLSAAQPHALFLPGAAEEAEEARGRNASRLGCTSDSEAPPPGGREGHHHHHHQRTPSTASGSAAPSGSSAAHTAASGARALLRRVCRSQANRTLSSRSMRSAGGGGGALREDGRRPTTYAELQAAAKLASVADSAAAAQPGPAPAHGRKSSRSLDGGETRSSANSHSNSGPTDTDRPSLASTAPASRTISRTALPAPIPERPSEGRATTAATEIRDGPATPTAHASTPASPTAHAPAVPSAGADGKSPHKKRGGFLAGLFACFRGGRAEPELPEAAPSPAALKVMAPAEPAAVAELPIAAAVMAEDPAPTAFAHISEPLPPSPVAEEPSAATAATTTASPTAAPARAGSGDGSVKGHGSPQPQTQPLHARASLPPGSNTGSGNPSPRTPTRAGMSSPGGSRRSMLGASQPGTAAALPPLPQQPSPLGRHGAPAVVRHSPRSHRLLDDDETSLMRSMDIVHTGTAASAAALTAARAIRPRSNSRAGGGMAATVDCLLASNGGASGGHRRLTREASADGQSLVATATSAAVAQAAAAALASGPPSRRITKSPRDTDDALSVPLPDAPATQVATAVSEAGSAASLAPPGPTPTAAPPSSSEPPGPIFSAAGPLQTGSRCSRKRGRASAHPFGSSLAQLDAKALAALPLEEMLETIQAAIAADDVARGRGGAGLAGPGPDGALAGPSGAHTVSSFLPVPGRSGAGLAAAIRRRRSGAGGRAGASGAAPARGAARGSDGGNAAGMGAVQTTAMKAAPLGGQSSRRRRRVKASARARTAAPAAAAASPLAANNSSLGQTSPGARVSKDGLAATSSGPRVWRHGGRALAGMGLGIAGSSTALPNPLATSPRASVDCYFVRQPPYKKTQLSSRSVSPPPLSLVAPPASQSPATAAAAAPARPSLEKAAVRVPGVDLRASAPAHVGSFGAASRAVRQLLEAEEVELGPWPTSPGAAAAPTAPPPLPPPVLTAAAKAATLPRAAAPNAAAKASLNATAGAQVLTTSLDLSALLARSGARAPPAPPPAKPLTPHKSPRAASASHKALTPTKKDRGVDSVTDEVFAQLVQLIGGGGGTASGTAGGVVGVTALRRPDGGLAEEPSGAEAFAPRQVLAPAPLLVPVMDVQLAAPAEGAAAAVHGALAASGSSREALLLRSLLGCAEPPVFAPPPKEAPAISLMELMARAAPVAVPADAMAPTPFAATAIAAAETKPGEALGSTSSVELLAAARSALVAEEVPAPPDQRGVSFLRLSRSGAAEGTGTGPGAGVGGSKAASVGGCGPVRTASVTSPAGASMRRSASTQSGSGSVLISSTSSGKGAKAQVLVLHRSYSNLLLGTPPQEAPSTGRLAPPAVESLAEAAEEQPLTPTGPGAATVEMELLPPEALTSAASAAGSGSQEELPAAGSRSSASNVVVAVAMGGSLAAGSPFKTIPHATTEAAALASDAGSGALLAMAAVGRQEMDIHEAAAEEDAALVYDAALSPRTSAGGEPQPAPEDGEGEAETEVGVGLLSGGSGAVCMTLSAMEETLNQFDAFLSPPEAE